MATQAPTCCCATGIASVPIRNLNPQPRSYTGESHSKPCTFEGQVCLIYALPPTSPRTCMPSTFCNRSPVSVPNRAPTCEFKGEKSIVPKCCTDTRTHKHTDTHTHALSLIHTHRARPLRLKGADKRKAVRDEDSKVGNIVRHLMEEDRLLCVSRVVFGLMHKLRLVSGARLKRHPCLALWHAERPSFNSHAPTNMHAQPQALGRSCPPSLVTMVVERPCPRPNETPRAKPSEKLWRRSARKLRYAAGLTCDKSAPSPCSDVPSSSGVGQGARPNHDCVGWRGRGWGVKVQGLRPTRACEDAHACGTERCHRLLSRT
jgi:hypothetical protein